MKKIYAKLKANLAKTAGLLMLLMAMMVPSGALGQETILSENFDGGETEFPTSNGWTTEVVEDWLFWEYSDGGNYNSCDGNRYPNAAYSGSYNASIQPLGYNTKMISPVLDLADYSEVTMSFMLAQPYIQYFDPDWGEYCYMHGNTVVSYKTNNSDEWVVITTITDILDSWTQKSVAIPTTATQIAFHYVKDGDMFGIVSIDDIVITGESGVTKYNINYATGLTGGSISGKTKAAEDEVVEVTVEPFEHWYFTNMTVTKTGESSTVVYTGSSNVFTMPAYDVDVTAIFAEKFYHYFTNNIPSSNADVRFEDYWGTEIYGAYVDDEVYVRITEKPGFELASLSYNSTPIDISSGTGLYSFTMPDADVSLTATFNTLEMYNISCSWVPATCGTISCSETALPGSTVTITPNAYSGYMIAYYVVKGVTSGNVIEVNGNQFTMPSEDVTVKGVFAVATAQEVEVLHEGFNNATNPPYNSTSTGWTEDSGFGSTSWGYSTGSQYVGGRCAMHSVSTKKMVTPTMNLSEASSARITFKLWIKWYEIFYVYYRSSPSDSWTLLQSYEEANWSGSLTDRNLNLPSTALTSTCQLAFAIEKYNGNGVWFDELYVYKTTSTPKYSITANAEHGDMYFNPSSPVAAGQTVTVNATASTGYRVTGITATNDVDGSPIMVTENQFTMPNAPVTVTATYEEVEVRNITITKEGNGTIYTNPEDIAEVGGTVYVYCYADYHWTYNDDLTITYEDGGTQQIVPEEVSYGIYSFTMPAFDVNINTSFTEEAKYAINVVKFGSEDSEITLSKSSPTYGYEYVTITANPAAGYMLGRLKVRKDATGEEITVTNNSFTMPAENVTVYASFYAGFNFEEHFESPFSSTGWTTYTTGSGNWQHASGGHTGNCAYCSWDNAYSEPTLITPALNLNGLEGLTMTFWRKQPHYNTGVCDGINIMYTLDDGTSWTSITKYETVADSYTEASIDIPAAACKNGVKFGFKAISKDQNGVYVDDVRIFKETTLPSYSITPSVTGNGELSFSPTGNVEVGTTVTVTASATAAGAALTSLSYLREDGRTIDIDIESLPYTFTMPECNTTVTAVFEAAPHCTVTLHVNGLTIGSENNAYVGCPFELPTAVALEGYTFYGWTDTDITQGTSVAPSKIAEPSAAEFFPAGDCELWAVFAKSEAGDEYTLMSTPSFEGGGSYIIGLVDTWGNTDPHAIDITDGNATVTLIQESSTGIVTSEAMRALALTANYSSTIGGYCLTDGTNHLKDNWGYEVASGSTATTSKDAFEIAWDSDYSRYGLKSMINDANYWVWFKTTMQGAITFEYNNYGGSPLKIYKAEMTNKYYTYIANAPINNSLTINGDASVTNPIIIGSGAVVTVNGTFTNSTASYLTIQDGGELILAQGNTGVMATVEKDIEAITSSKGDGYTVDKWYTIGSSVNTPYINNDGETNHVENMIPVGGVDDLSYNLYYLDMTKELPWINYRQGNGVTGFNQLENGRGYLYSNQAATTVEYVGELNTENVNRDVNEGWNLVSNPFAQTIAFSGFALNSGSMAGYYTLDGAGGWKTTMSTADVKNNQGILINVPEEASSVTISRPENDGAKRGESRDEEYAYVEINVSNANYSDRTYAAYTEANCLPKYNHQNAKIQKVYIPQGDGNFAIACMEKSTTLFPVNFKAMTTGEYTINLNATEDINYLVLVDNMTGEEINMLIEDSYSFIGSTSDNERRFTVKLGFSQDLDSEDNSNFVYQNGNELIINGEGTIQIIDLLGRVIVSKEVHGGTVSVGNLITGAYIVRMIGNEVKTQKIVIR